MVAEAFVLPFNTHSCVIDKVHVCNLVPWLRIYPTLCQAGIKVNLCIYTVNSEHKNNVPRSKQMNTVYEYSGYDVK